jgi:hypothetical protein
MLQGCRLVFRLTATQTNMLRDQGSNAMKTSSNSIIKLGGVLIGASLVSVFHHHQSPPAHLISSAITEAGFIVAGLYLIANGLSNR